MLITVRFRGETRKVDAIFRVLPKSEERWLAVGFKLGNEANPLYKFLDDRRDEFYDPILQWVGKLFQHANDTLVEQWEIN